MSRSNPDDRAFLGCIGAACLTGPVALGLLVGLDALTGRDGQSGLFLLLFVLVALGLSWLGMIVAGILAAIGFARGRWISAITALVISAIGLASLLLAWPHAS